MASLRLEGLTSDREITVGVINFCILKLEMLRLFSLCSYNSTCVDTKVSHVLLQFLVLLKCQICEEVLC